MSLKEGQIVRCPKQGIVYKIQGGRKRPISTDVYNKMGRPKYVFVDCKALDRMRVGSPWQAVAAAVVARTGARAPSRSSPSRRSPSSRSPSRRSPSRRSPSRRSPSRSRSSTPTRKASPARRAAAKRAAVKRAPARRAAVRKAAVRKAAVRRKAVKKAAVRKAAVRKAAVRKAAVRKAAVRKAAVRKAAVKKAARKAAVRKAAVRKAAARPVVVRRMVRRKPSPLKPMARAPIRAASPRQVQRISSVKPVSRPGKPITRVVMAQPGRPRRVVAHRAPKALAQRRIMRPRPFGKPRHMRPHTPRGMPMHKMHHMGGSKKPTNSAGRDISNISLQNLRDLGYFLYRPNIMIKSKKSHPKRKPKRKHMSSNAQRQMALCSPVAAAHMAYPNYYCGQSLFNVHGRHW